MAAGEVTGDASLPTPLRLREALAAVSQAFDSGDLAAADTAVSAVVGLLDAAAAAGGDESAGSDGTGVSEELLREVHGYLSCPSSSKMAIDALSLELPEVVAKLGALSGNGREIAAAVVEFFVSNCSPRDMLSILCEALDTQLAGLKEPAYFALLFNGLARVLTLIQRRHIEQIKVALPIVLKVLEVILLECHDEQKSRIVDVFKAAFKIGGSMQEVCKLMVDRKKKELCAILGLYALQNIALISRSTQLDMLSTSCSLVLQFSGLLSFCGFSYFGLVTGCDVTSATDEVSKEEGDDFLDCSSLATDGAILAVMWACEHDGIMKSAELEAALKKLQDNHTEKWQAFDMFKYVLSSVNYPWEIQSRTIELLLIIMDGGNAEEADDDVDFSSHTPSVFVTLQAVERIMMAAPDASLRKKAFAALKKVISKVPSSQRFDILKALIMNSMSPSLTAILLDIVKAEVLRESREADNKTVEFGQTQNGKPSRPWSSHALELVEFILRPPEGGPPPLPDHAEQVLSALNLLRFILIMDSKGPSSSKVLPEKMLRKVYSDWLIPLRPLVTEIQAESEKDDSEPASQITFALNPVQLVLYRCIELVEESMNRS